MTKIDLRAPIIAPHVRCWRLFPGGGYRFLDTFKDQGVAFLDMPGFQMPETPLTEANDLPKRIRVSEIILEKISKQGKHQEYSVENSEISGFRVGRKRQRNQQALINFFEHAEAGDVIIMPEPLYVGRVQVGILASPRLTHINATSPKNYGPNKIPARQVQWIKSIEENKISTNLSKSLRHQHPFSILEKSLFLEVFSIAFDSYVYGDHHSSVIFNRKDDYTDRETSLLGIISSLSATFCQAEELGISSSIDTLDAILNNSSIEFHCSQASDIHSPGFSRFTSSKRTALIIAALVSAIAVLSYCNHPSELQSAIQEIEFINSSAQPNDECTAFVSTAANRILESMGSDRMWKICQAMRDAEARAGLESSAKILN